ncbi:MAG: hypothetical protein SVK08_02915 [Halobacteriota archaeon]|nr:hypothetical protein [Halobacteriota archaeon]
MNQEQFEFQKAVKEEIRAQFPDVVFPEVYLDNVFRGFTKETASLAANRKMVVVEYEDKDGPAEYEAAVVSDEYLLVPHEVSIYHFLKAIEKSPEYGKPNLNIRMLGYGEKMIAEATFPDVQFDIPGNERKVGDMISAKAILQNSVDTSLEHGIRFGGEVLRCTNGVKAFKALERHSQKHRLNLDVEVQMATLTSGMETLSEQHGIWKTWTQMQIAHDKVAVVLNELPFSGKQQEEILALPETGTGVRLQDVVEEKGDVSLWQLNSVATQFISHELELTPARVKREEDFTRSMQRVMKNEDFFRRAA